MKLTLGEECLILRRRAKLHLVDIAKKLKTSHTTLSRIEIGDYRATEEKGLIYRGFLMEKHGKNVP
jgi:transcriptional regulator with XRE-family HTH domain